MTIGDLLALRPDCAVDHQVLVWSDRLAQALAARRARHRQFDEHPLGWPDIEDFVRGADDGAWPARRNLRFPLERQAPVGKDDLRRDGRSFANLGDRRDEVLWSKATSGTSGRPVDVIYANGFYLDHLLLTLPRICDRAGIAVPAGSCAVAVTDNPGCGPEIWIDAGRDSAILQLVLATVDAEAVRAAADAISAIRPYAVSLKPNIMALLAEHLPADARLACGCVVASGARMGADDRDAFEKRFGVPVVEAYGLTEFGIVASECPMRSGLHVDGDVIAEVLDDGGRDVPETATGRLVLTAVRNPAMPLVRYRTDDVVALTRRPCACGRATPRIVALRGRAMPNYRLPSGRQVPPVVFNPLMGLFPVAEFQLTQRGAGLFALKVQPMPGAALPVPEIAAWAARHLEDGVVLRVEVGPIDVVAGKFARFRTEWAGDG